MLQYLTNRLSGRHNIPLEDKTFQGKTKQVKAKHIYTYIYIFFGGGGGRLYFTARPKSIFP